MFHHKHLEKNAKNIRFFSKLADSMPLKDKLLHQEKLGNNFLEEIPGFKNFGENLAGFIEKQPPHPNIKVYKAHKIPYRGSGDFLYLRDLPPALKNWLTELDDREIQRLRKMGFHTSFFPKIEEETTDYASREFPYVDVKIKDLKSEETVFNIWEKDSQTGIYKIVGRVDTVPVKERGFNYPRHDVYLRLDSQYPGYGVYGCQRVNIFSKGLSQAIESYEKSHGNKLEVFDREKIRQLQTEAGYSLKDINRFSIWAVARANEFKLTQEEHNWLKKQGYTDELNKNFNQRLIKYESLDQDGKLYIKNAKVGYDYGNSHNPYTRRNILGAVDRDLQEEGLIKVVSGNVNQQEEIGDSLFDRNRRILLISSPFSTSLPISFYPEPEIKLEEETFSIESCMVRGPK